MQLTTMFLALIATTLSACATGSHSQSAAKEETPVQAITPIALEKSFLDGKGLVAEDPSEYDDYTQSESQPQSRSHLFHQGKILVTVVDVEPAKVRVEGLPYDEFIQILKGRLILTLDDGREFEFEQGDSLVLPKGWTGTWHMPEPYRELVVIDTPESDSH